VSTDPTRPEDAAPSARAARERLLVFAWEHPVLGRFEIRVDFEAGASARLSLESRQLRLRAPTGVLIRTPAELPNISVTEVTLDLTSGALGIVSEPPLGSFGEQLLGEFIRDSVLAGFDPGAVLARASNADDRISLYEGSLVKVHACALSSVTLALTRRALELTLSKPIVLDFGRLLGKTEISTLIWSFTSGTLSARLTGQVNLWSRVVGRVTPVLGRFYFRRFVPAEMLEPGFDITRDRALGPHIAAMLRGLAGGATAGGRPAPAPGPPPRITVEPGDALELVRDREGVELRTEHGLFLDAPGRPWVSRFRLLSARWDAASQDLTIRALPALGEAVRGGLATLLRLHLVEPVANAITSLPRDRDGRAIVPLGDADLHLADGTLTARLDGRRLNIEAAPRALVVARPKLARFALRRLTYDTAQADIDAEISGASCLGRIFVGRARKVLPKELGKFLAEQLPPAMQIPDYDLFADPDQAKNLALLVAAPVTEAPKKPATAGPT